MELGVGLMRPLERAPGKTLLTPAEVGQLFRVDPKTVSRWASRGRLSAVRTLGGHRRYLADEVDRLYEELTTLAD